MLQRKVQNPLPRLVNFHPDLAFGLAVLAFGLDQLSKYWIEAVLGPYGSGKTLEVAGGLVFRYYKNRGASNNLLENVPWFLALVAVLAVAAAILYYLRAAAKSTALKTGIGLLVGGGLGNLSDRLFKQGYVTDFIHLNWLPLWKTFNLADLSIRGGVVVLLIYFVMKPALDSRRQKQIGKEFQ